MFRDDKTRTFFYYFVEKNEEEEEELPVQTASASSETRQWAYSRKEDVYSGGSTVDPARLYFLSCLGEAP